MCVTVFAHKAAVTDAAGDRVAHPVTLRRTVARLHAVVAEVTLGTKLRAVVSGVPGRAAAVAVVGAAGGVRRAAARLRARRAPPARAARRLAALPAPARQALALASNMMAIRTILTGALLFTVNAVSAKRARVFTRHTRKTAGASIHTRYRVTRRVTSR